MLAAMRLEHYAGSVTAQEECAHLRPCTNQRTIPWEELAKYEEEEAW